MKTYRYGLFENLLGDCCYVIHRKCWIGWLTAHEFGSKQKMLDVVNQLKQNGHIVYEV